VLVFTIQSETIPSGSRETRCAEHFLALSKRKFKLISEKSIRSLKKSYH